MDVGLRLDQVTAVAYALREQLSEVAADEISNANNNEGWHSMLQSHVFIAVGGGGGCSLARVSRSGRRGRARRELQALMQADEQRRGGGVSAAGVLQATVKVLAPVQVHASSFSLLLLLQEHALLEDLPEQASSICCSGSYDGGHRGYS